MRRIRFSRFNLTHLCMAIIVLCGLVFVTLLSFTHPTSAASEDSVISTGDHYITIHDQSEKLTIKTDATTVGEALARAEIKVESPDYAEPSLDTPVNADNFHINIYRARPIVIVDGLVQKYIMTASHDPKTIAAEAGFTVYDGDEIKLTEGAGFLATGATPTYEISRNGGRTITVETTIPFTERTIKDYNITQGETSLTQVGEDGRMVSQYQVNFVDGVEVSRELISETVVKQPVERIITEGAKYVASIPPEQATCAEWARQAGVSDSDLAAALAIIYHESGCRVNATNASSGAYGIPQALPGSKMASEGSDWQTNPVTQIRWMAKYVSRYGGWQGALAFWNSHHWY